MLKAELDSLIKRHKSRYQIYEIIAYVGHCAIRLSPYHPDLNSKELVWAFLKQYVTARYVDFNFKNVDKIIFHILCEKFFCTFSKKDWRKQCQHTKEFEQFYMDKELVRFRANSDDNTVEDFDEGSSSEEDP
ncbi:hypothetical protein ABEB36_013142 [Hypothenemus hampei]|uniref:Uncharacterized protein n=1 Tax=Hypothenemus hampei TaxID=57062 RepID=A0ABD1E7A9_HYPHA